MAGDYTPEPFEERVLHEATFPCGGFYKYTFRIALVGDQGSGKTSLLQRLLSPDAVPGQQSPTFMADFKTCTFVMEDFCEVRVQMWDASGAEHARKVVGNMFQPDSPECCDAAVVCFDLSRESSLEGVQYWLDMIHQQGASPVLTLCGTMGDKPIRRVTTFHMGEFAAQHGLTVTEACAETGQGVKELFQGLAQYLYDVKEGRREVPCVEKEPEPQKPPVAAPAPESLVTRSPSGRVYSHHTFKYLLLGAAEVGKTSTVTRLADNMFDEAYVPTVVPELATVDFYIGDAHVECKVWDLPGSDISCENQHPSADTLKHFEGAVGAVMVFDLMSAASFKWLKAYHLLLQLDRLPGRVVVGNKADVAARQPPEVSSEDARGWAEANGLEYAECSARTGQGVDELFRRLTAQVWERTVVAAQQLQRRVDIWSRRVEVPRFAQHDITHVIFTEEQLRLTFDKLDVQGRGFIPMQDFQLLNQGFEDMGLTEQEIARVLGQSRKHVPGQLTFNEFAVLMLRVAKA
eukprot:EG_transcript_6904